MSHRNDNIMNAPRNQPLSDQVERALADLEHLRIDPGSWERLPEYPLMIGGFGTVTAAKLGDQIVAIKELRITGGAADRVRFSMRFARELKVWALLDHPNLVKLSGFHTDGDMSVAQFICPFYAHGHIRDYIDATEPDQETRFRLAADTALGLQHLHGLNIVHGDLKELNVLVAPEPRALLCDYGIARMINPDGKTSGLTTTGMPVSVRFASPELMNGSQPDLSSDIWAWGCLFLKIVEDVGPYDGVTDLACIGKIIGGLPPTDVSALQIPPSLRHMLQECWNLESSARPNITRCISIIALARPFQAPYYQQDNKRQLWDSMSKVSVKTLDSHLGSVSGVAFSSDGSLLASGSSDESVRLWDVNSGTTVKIFDHSTTVWALDLGSNGRLAFGGYGKEIRVCNTTPRASTLSARDLIISTDGSVRSISFSPDCSRLAAAVNSNVLMWDAVSGKLLFTARGRDSVHVGSFSPNGIWLASGSNDMKIRIWDAVGIMAPQMSAQQPPLATLEGHTREILAIAFSPGPDVRLLASGSYEHTIHIWDTSSWTPLVTLKPESGVRSLAFSPDVTRLAIGSTDGKLQLWDTASWISVMVIDTMDKGNWYVEDLAFSPDGARIAAACAYDKVQIWHATPSADQAPHDSPIAQTM